MLEVKEVGEPQDFPSLQSDIREKIRLPLDGQLLRLGPLSSGSHFLLHNCFPHGGDRGPAARAPERARQARAVGSERANPASPHPSARGIQQEPAAPRPPAAKQTKGRVASSGDDQPLSLEKLPCSSPRWPRAALHHRHLPDARQRAALSFWAAANPPGGAADLPLTG